MTTKFDIGDHAYLIVMGDPAHSRNLFGYKPVTIRTINVCTGEYGLLERYGIEGEPHVYQSQLLFHHQDEALAYIEALNETLR